MSFVDPAAPGRGRTRRPALSGPRSVICTSIAARCAAESRLDLGRLREQPDDPAHGALSGPRPTLPYGELGETRSEARQVLAELPGGHLLVVAVPLVALHADVVVDVRPRLAPAAERRAEDVVAARARRRLEQGRRQRPQAARAQLVERDACRGSRSSARRGRARSPIPSRPAASTAAAARYGLQEPSIVRSSIRPGAGIRSIWVRLL